MQVIMADFKIWDDDLHKKYTGVSNKPIKENFIKANSLGIPIIARTPVIPEIDQDIKSISEFLYGLKNVIQYELLPYHPLGASKRMALNLPPDGFSVPQKSFMKEFDKYVFIR
jgi:pyruvate formate lyase activating enzyme